MGIIQRAEIISKSMAFSKKSDLFYRVRRLIDEKQMGKLFKVMLIKKKNNNFKTGFSNWSDQKLLKIKNIKHGFFNKTGGKSKKIYSSLNCGLGSKDDPSNVKKNLRIVIKIINKKAKNIFLLHQIHSNKFVFIDQKNLFKPKPKADAVITNQKHLPIGILTADCVPILICDERKNLIAAIHAGWKGAYKDIISKVINFMIKKGSNPRNITAAIGPAISVTNYG